MLAGLQKYLTDIYQVDQGVEVTDFLITDPALAKLLGYGSLVPNTDESVLLSQDEEGLALSLYLDGKMLSRLVDDNPMEQLRTDHLDDFCKVIEGISHFNYIVWRASQDKCVTLLELEMQAEVDKFVGTWLMALDQEEYELARCLHGLLFDRVSYNPNLDRDQLERYRAANDYAARFCHGLRRRLNHDGNRSLHELRHFYRLSQTAKISHIRSQAYNPS
ncbi:MAG: hypothetical protein WD448_05030 [Woeseia sp.]